MQKNLYIDASHPEETRIVLKSESNIEEYESENSNNLSLKSNIYLGKVSRVEPSLQAAFVDFGRERHGFLAFNDIQSDYYQIPTEDKEELKKAEEKIREDLKEKNENTDGNNNEEVDNNQVPTNNNAENTNELKSQESNQTEKIREKLKNRYGIRKYRIQEVVRPGQVMLIQVMKEERGQKGAALTTFVSLAGKYIVLMPNTAKGGGISRKIFNYEERSKVREILKNIDIPSNMGLIVRTAGARKTRNEIDNDLKNTITLWEKIKNNAISSTAPVLIHEEGDVIKRSIRDIYDNDTKYIHVEGNEGYQKAKSFMKELMPKNSKYVKKYRGKIPLFHSVGIEKDLNKIFEPLVKLKSGGYLVINPTEALVAIDVNSGQSTKQMNIEKTALNTNLEAAEEISRQIKIRDLSGLIVIDFIDMINFHNKKMVERKMKERLRLDRARIQVGRISNFGLLEMTRQRLRESSVKWETNLSMESYAQKIIKKIEMLAFSNKTKIISAYVPEKINIYLKSFFGNEISFFEKKYKFKINIISDNNLIIPEYKIHLFNKNKKIINQIENLKKINGENNRKYNNKKNSYQENLSQSSQKNKKKVVKGLGKTLWVRRKKVKSN
ncbi:MAG: ribonuclease E/G [Candidatus Pelagibacter sp.]|nr:ribonuclease E/G [Candidatus Pelagibacter sp.]|tara:strand:- start:4193 stop:6022 length:1830 start_codon:yes stop_codon:yes gene_type:complete